MDIGKMKLDDGWLAARYTEVNVNGVQLTTTHPPTGPGAPWMKAVVPGTVLTTLLENNLLPDPFYGLQNECVIDIADSGRDYYTFWFFKKFSSKQSRNQYLDLTFRAINYSAEVFLNGHKKILQNGMFRRHSIDVTDILNPGGHNLLAVLLHPPGHPGRIPPQGGQGGDHEIGKDVAAQYVEGWDWMTPIRDRNTGIWDEVSISVTGPVKIIDPHLVASFFDNYKRVYLHASVELENKCSWIADCSLTIQVTTDIEGNICLIEHLQTQHISIPSHRRVLYTFPQLFFYKPNLWWPNGMGKQSLYHVNIAVDVKGFGLSDSWKHQFGFRKIECYIDEKTGGRLFNVNGQHVFIRGGNWILSDALLRLSERRYETDIKFHADMNLNMIRCWGGGLAERPEFYYWCDVYGLMVWQEFWITGDCDGRGDPISNVNGPIDHDLFLLCAWDTVRLLRNHASLVIWVGGNEQIPPDDINKALKDDLKLHPYFEDSYWCCECRKNLYAVKDPSEYLDGTRVYVQGSLWDGFAGGDGSFTDGPYNIQNPEDFFMEGFYKYGFNPEAGSVGMPVAATIKATMPAEGWQIPLFQKLPDGYIKEVPHPLWEYHKYLPYSNPGHVHDQILSYGEPKDLDDFCLKAQLVNYIQYRALLEGWSSFMWTKYTGILIWKTQNPWTGLRGQLYDFLHDQTAGFYGCRHAAEAIHVQLNLATQSIEVVNTTCEALDGVSVEASVWDLEGNCPYYKVFDKLSVPTKKTECIGKLMYPNSKSPKPVYFFLLKLYNPSNYFIFSRNFYWLHLPGGDYRLLEPYKLTRIPLKITSETVVKGSTYKVQMQVSNVSRKPSNRSMLYDNDFVKTHADADSDLSSTECIRHEDGLLRSLGKKLLKRGGGVRVTEVEGSHAGVSFFLHFSVHASEKDQGNGKDTRILPVHYSDNYFSLVPGEKMSISISFEAPPGVTPRIRLNGWNFHSGHEIH